MSNWIDEITVIQTEQALNKEQVQELQRRFNICRFELALAIEANAITKITQNMRIPFANEK